MMTEILARAPTRIDFAGGTLDIWPISLMVEGARTLNAAIDLYATTRLSARGDPVIRIRSLDRGIEEEYPSLAEARPDGSLGFLTRLLHALPPPSGVELVTECAAPAGSGLGGSSALGISVAAALTRLRGEELNPAALLEMVQAVETRVLRVPTGVQDYYPALMGGFLSLRYTVHGTEAVPIRPDLDQWRERTILCFSGRPRFSGLSNWDALRRYLDGDTEVKDGLNSICGATRGMEEALRDGDVERAATALDQDWQARRKISEKVCTPEVEKLIEVAKSSGALAGKVCGAGGGGCLVFLVAAGKRREVEGALEANGAHILPFSFCQQGVEIEERADIRG